MPPRKVASKGSKAAAAAKPSPRGGDEDGGGQALGQSGGAHYASHVDLDLPKVYIKPDDQLQLSEEQLNEEITMIFTANNPNAPKNIARYSYKERIYKFDPTVDQVAVHFHMDGYLIPRDSDEAKRQIVGGAALEEARAEEAAEAAKDGADGEDGEDGHRTLRNQFNFSERATQTYHNQSKDRATVTEPPPSTTFSATATQWEIFDAYKEDIERNRSAKEKAAKRNKGDDEGGDASNDGGKPHLQTSDDIIYSNEMEKSLKIVERMVNQNTYDEILQDFKYYEDQSDNFKDTGEGTLLPLWKFSNDKFKKKHVTGMCWNHEFSDMFAVAYGSYDFMKQGTGAVACFSLKNASNAPDPSYPESTFTTESGVTALDFHPAHSSLLAVGCYDGNVMVFDVRNKTNKPIFQSSAKTGKHTDPVWQVFWQEEDLAKNLNFFSISSDGRVTLWTLSKNELQHTDVLHLKLVGVEKDREPDEETTLTGLAGGCCFDFNRFSEHLFLVGTEEGTIHKCSKAYNSQYLQTYEGHYMNVYSVRWNKFHPRLFLSASADWTVKLWDHQQKSALMSFDLNNAVGDVAWAPYSSTVFAAVTADGKVHVFDLNESKHEPLCEQQVVKSKLTHLCFNPHEPILLVGDDRGCVTSLKLSPNLRKPHGPKEAASNSQQASTRAGARAQATGQTTVKEEADPAQVLEQEQQLLEKILSLGDGKGDNSTAG